MENVEFIGRIYRSSGYWPLLGGQGRLQTAQDWVTPLALQRADARVLIHVFLREATG